MNHPLLLLLGYAVVRAFALTYRFRDVAPVLAPGSPRPLAYMLAIWHQNLFAGILAQSAQQHCVMVSRSRDGDPVTYLCEKLGHRVLRGSSRRKDGRDKGGKEAKDQMIEVMRAGLPGAVTVDGPMGPAHVVKAGIVEMARLTGIPIVPYLPMPSRYWSLKSWDKFRLPKPFTRIDIHYGAPIHVPAELASDDYAAYQQKVGDALIALEAGLKKA